MLPLQLDTSAGSSYGLFPESSFVPWASKIGFCDKAQFAKAPKQGAMVCFPIYQFQDDFNSARPLWSFTEDPDHQGFYGTCYIKPRAVSFPNVFQVQGDSQTDFRFQSKCIPCDNIGQDLTNPRWGPQQTYCTDCSKLVPPAAPRQLPAVPTWAFVSTGTFAGAAHWLSPGGSPVAFQDECKMLANRDPTCSKYVMYSDYRASRYGGKIQGVSPGNLNVNSSAAVKLINTSVAWHYTPVSLQFAYYRTCACLDATATQPPAIDLNMTKLACDGVVASQCIFRNFSIYKLP